MLNPEGGKLSKRHGHSSVKNLREAGYLWQAVVNYLGVLGSGDPKQSPVMTLADLQKHFKLEALSVAKPMFDEAKLNFFNEHYIRLMSPAEITSAVEWLKPHCVSRYANFFASRSDDSTISYLTNAFKLMQARITTLQDLVEVKYLFEDPHFSAEESKRALQKVSNAEKLLSDIHARLVSLEPWNEKTLSDLLNGMNNKKAFFQPLRFAVSGAPGGPDLINLLVLLGRERTVSRIGSLQRCLSPG